MTMLKKGDTIKCKDADDAVTYMQALIQEGYDCDFVYEMNGIKGIWLEITKGKGIWSDVIKRMKENREKKGQSNEQTKHVEK